MQCSAAESGLNPRCVAVVDGSQGLAVEREETGRGGGAFDSAAAAAGYGGLLPPLGTNAVDFRCFNLLVALGIDLLILCTCCC